MEEQVKTQGKEIAELRGLILPHIANEDKAIDLYGRVLFGDKATGEIGMKKKVDEMHEILVGVRNVSNFLGGIKGVLGWLILFGAVIALFKGWLISIVSYVVTTKP